MAITITFQDLTSTSLYAEVTPVPSGSSWGQIAFPISGWQQGQNPSGDIAVNVSGYSGYQATMVPSGSMETAPFSSDVTVALAIFTTKD